MINDDQEIIEGYEKQIGELIEKREELFNYIYSIEIVEWGEKVVSIREDVPLSVLEIIRKELKQIDSLIDVRIFELEEIKGIENYDGYDKLMSYRL